MKTDYFKNKTITLMGLGLLGRGVGDAKFLAEQGAELIVTDLKTKEELKPSLDQLKEYKNISYTLGEHKLEDFKDRDLIIKGAGVPLDSPYIAEAKKNNIPVRMSADLLVGLAGAKTVGVTGTRGKSTIAHLIAHALLQAGKHVLLGGNVRGVSNLALLDDVGPDTILVLELDSWQLQGFGQARISPNIAVFSNLKQDHRNYYKDEETYFADKANIFKFQKNGDVLISGKDVTDSWIRSTKPPVDPAVPRLLPQGTNLKILGEHNRENAALASEALRALGLTKEEIKQSLESFEPVKGRLELVGEIDGIRIYNDNNATTPDATLAALNTLSNERNIVLIFGGADKQLDMTTLIGTLSKFCRSLVLLSGTGTDKIRSFINDSEFEHVVLVESMQEAVQRARDFARAGDIILLSPAFASFGMFKNEYDRSEQFIKNIQTLWK